MNQLTEEQQRRVEQIKRYSRLSYTVSDDNQVAAGLLRDARTDIEFLLSLLDSDSQAAGPAHGFAPMDTLSDVCGAYTSYGYCWRPRKDPAHEATGMMLSPCNTPAQGFNAEREKKVADHAATAMRDKCVEAIRGLKPSATGAGAFKNAAIRTLQCLTLEQVKPGEM